MKKLEPILRTVDSISEWSGRIVCFFILPMLCVLLYEVTSRYVFHAPTLWAHEISNEFYGVYFILGGAYALLHGSHVLTDVLVMNLSTRKRAIVDTIFWLVFFFYIILLLWKGGEMAWSSILRRETTQTVFHSPIWWVKAMIPVGAALTLLQGIATFIRHLSTAITGKKEGTTVVTVVDVKDEVVG